MIPGKKAIRAKEVAPTATPTFQIFSINLVITGIHWFKDQIRKSTEVYGDPLIASSIYCTSLSSFPPSRVHGSEQQFESHRKHVTFNEELQANFLLTPRRVRSFKSFGNDLVSLASLVRDLTQLQPPKVRVGTHCEPRKCFYE